MNKEVNALCVSDYLSTNGARYNKGSHPVPPSHMLELAKVSIN
jgi:hypothetical protein